MDTLYQIGNREFRLDQQKAKAAFSAKRVINGRQNITFNLLPLRYGWAYDQYREMKDNHWGPMAADVAMHVDSAQWRSDDLTPRDRWLVKMTVGCLLSAQAKGAADIQQVIRELVTAPELKLVLGREVHQENLRMEAVLFMIFSLGLNPHECEAIFAGTQLKSDHKEPVALSNALHRGMNLDTTENRCCLAREIFHFGQCVKGLRHYSLFATLLDLDEGKLPGTRKLLDYILRDESSRVEVLRNLFLELVTENPELKSDQFRAELVELMRGTVDRETAFARGLLEGGNASFSIEHLESFIGHVADCRLRACGLSALSPRKQNPIPRLTSALHFRENPGVQMKQVLQQCFNDDDL